MNRKDLKFNEKSQNKTTSKSCSNLISNLQPPNSNFSTLTSHLSHLTSNSRGITLIALVITIIVMLILVAVTVTVAINGGLFGTAKDAARKTQYEADKESLLSAVIGAINDNAEVEFEILDKNLPEGFTGTKDNGYTSKSGNTFYVDSNGNITDEKVNSEQGNEPTGGGWTLNDNGQTATRGDVTVNIGDYVDYKPDEGGTYPAAELGKIYTGSTYNTSGALTTEADLKWRILGVDENGCLTLISDKPTSTKVYFKGAKGYNNGVYILNDICARLYSNKDLGVTARSLTIEDVEAGFSDTGINARDEYNKDSSDGVQYGQPKTYTGTGSSVQYPALYEKEKRFWYRGRSS